MSLKEIKEFQNMPIIRCFLPLFLSFFVIFIGLSLSSIALDLNDEVEFAFDEYEPASPAQRKVFKIKEIEESNSAQEIVLRKAVNLDYQSYLNIKEKDLSPINRDLNGVFSSELKFTSENLFWINEKLDRDNLIQSLKEWPLDVSLNANSDVLGIKNILFTLGGIKYENVNFSIENNYINLWSKLTSKNLDYVLRGRIYNVKSGLKVLFVISVYKLNVPIYVFGGESLLKG